ncbi:hypothetical protein C3F09_12045 [candidate division GN15 bacterium]|uniref:DUF885 domain-containing protein n=1 Tax=candidate division GN15 bacterium TaxID=2072418 RepID=A0A855WVZ0_9BACT|nr:MAG: hypothetical protein C3F09_12045 [candidate division GN15 bacterium]
MPLRYRLIAALCVAVVIAASQFSCAPSQQNTKAALNRVAEQYVKLILRVGQYSPYYIDAYSGPAEWKPAPLADSTPQFPYEQFKAEADGLLDSLVAIEKAGLPESQKRRWRTLNDHVLSMQGMIDLLNGKQMTFDEESMAVYRVKAPSFSKAYYDSLLAKLDELLPGKGDLPTRYLEFRKQFLVPHDKVDTLVRAAIAYCRATTEKYIELPDSEKFVVEMVSRQPWGAYNWYKGNFVSLIQVDTSKDIGIDQIVGLAAHEGYPGHHVQNLVEDGSLYRDSGRVEYCVAPLFSPRIYGEGEANYAVKLVFPREQWLTFMKSTVCPIAGIDTTGVARYYDALQASKKLKYAEIQVARDVVDGKLSKEDALASEMRYGLVSQNVAEDMLAFFAAYRSYIITYSIGEDLVGDYIQTNGGTDDKPARQWELYRSLLMNPMTGVDLQKVAAKQ